MSQEESWIEAMKAKGHSPKLNDDGSLDNFALDEDCHNGPGCVICNWSCCWHCDEFGDIPECECIDGAVAPHQIEFCGGPVD